MELAPVRPFGFSRYATVGELNGLFDVA